jgi:hypothetical protein
MFRKIAIALVAAGALTVPALAQQTSPSGESKLSPSTSAPTVSSTEKTDKLTTTPSKHRMSARHHHHGAKMAKYTKSHPKMGKYARYGKAKYGKAKYGKYTRPMKHGRTSASFMSTARASAKPIHQKATNPSLSKRGAKRSVD